MTAQFKELMQKTNSRKVINDLIQQSTGYTMPVYEVNGVRTFGERVEFFDKEKFAELIVRECAQLARDTDLEDVEGGDSAVLRAAKSQILEHFGVEE